jgi:hypothetical protein
MEVMLTTTDNPYDPFTQFDKWQAFDESKGYFSLAYLARVSEANTDMSDEQYKEEVSKAISDIVFYDPLGIYKKVTKE